MPLRIVSATALPARTEPANSKMTASTHACLIVSAFEPTLVAYLRSGRGLGNLAECRRLRCCAGKTIAVKYAGEHAGKGACMRLESTYAFATSLAPMPKAARKAVKPPITTIHRNACTPKQ
eukprot:6186542-Pleurochrysis_carterae.AAC.1